MKQAIHVPTEHWSRPALLLSAILRAAPSAVRLLLVLLVFVAPLAYEGIAPGSALLIELIGLTLLLLWTALRLSAPAIAPLDLRHILWPIAMVGIVILIQLLPFPLDIVSRLSPTMAKVVQHTYPLLPARLSPTSAPLTPSPGDTLHGALRLLLLVSLFVVARDQLRSMPARKLFVHLLLLSGIVQVALGLVHHYYGAQSIYFVPDGYPNDPHFFGSFVSANRNATYLNMLWPLAMSLGLSPIFWGDRGPSSMTPPPHGRYRHGELVFSDIAYLAISALLIYGVVLCNSRGGWLVMAWALLTTPLALWARAGRPRLALGLWFASLSAALAALLMFWDPLLHLSNELTEKTHQFSRPLIWRHAWEMARNHPFLGVGWEGFGAAFAASSPLEGYFTFIHSDNTYLDIVSELGIPGALLLAGALGAITWRVVRSRFWRQPLEQATLLGMLISLVGLLVHTGTEHTTRGYGVSVTAALIAGMLVGALESPGAREFPPALQYGPPPRKAWLPLAVLPIAWLLTGCIAMGEFGLEWGLNALHNKQLNAARPELELAFHLAPWSSSPARFLGAIERRTARQRLNLSLDQDSETAMKTLSTVPRLHERATTYLSLAVARAPLDGFGQRALSDIAKLRGDRELALALAVDACRVQPNEYRGWKQRGDILTWLRRPEEALEAFGQAMAKAPQEALAGLAGDLIFVSGRNPAVAGHYVPDRGHSDIPFAFGEALSRRALYPEAVQWFARYLESNPDHHAPVSRLGRIALANGDLILAETAAGYLLDKFSDFFGGYALSAEVLAARGDLPAAARLMERAAELDPPGADELVWIVKMWRKAGKDTRALSLVTKWEKSSISADLFLEKAAILKAAGELSEAGRALRRARALAPRREEPHFRLWQLHSEMGGAGLLRDAREELEQCLKLSRAPRCRYAAGKLALKRGDTSTAVRLLRDSATQFRTNSDAWRVLGEALLQHGDRERAEEALNRALILNPSDRRAQKMKDELSDSRGPAIIR